MSDEPDEKPRPPYFKYAFSNPYNYAVMGGFASAALLTQNWWLGLAGAGAEALWMLFAPDSRLLRKLWFDKRFDEEQTASKRALLDLKLKGMPETEMMRCMALQEKHEQIMRLAAENPSLTLDLLRSEINKLEQLVWSFIELSVTCTRYQEYLRSIDVDELERDIRRHQQTVDREKAPSEKRGLAQKNLEVCMKRRDKYNEIRTYLQSARGQLELIENTFRLLADQIVTMRSPTELTGQLDELMDGVESVRQTTRETEKILQTVEH
jgi:hypothetical protein